MKKLFLVIMALGMCHLGFSQKIQADRVPSVILNQFNTQFPKATDIKWKKVIEYYKVEFETGRDIDHDVWYNSEGKMVKHKEEISARELPTVIKEYIKQNYAEYKIDDVDKITEGKNVTYKVEIEKRDREINLYFNENGTLIQ